LRRAQRSDRAWKILVMFPTALRREIIILLLIKAVLLTALYVLFFSHSEDAHMTVRHMQSHILNDKPI
jgi:uncharacterized protein involved in cysteine biosynthesis